MTSQVQNTKSEVDAMKRDLNLKKIHDDMEVRLRVVEEFFKRRKGQFVIDPRIIIFIILVILLILFLRSLGR